MHVQVVGAGFVGCVTAVVLAENGATVDLVESDPAKREALLHGRPHFEEPGLADALAEALAAGRLRVADAPRDADVGILCVGTPPRPDGAADLSQVEAAARQTARHVRVLAVKSTVPPGTLRRIVMPAVDHTDVRLASMPEFLCEGSALQDARHPQRVVVGADDPWVAEQLAALHPGGRVIHTTPEAAETIKYASNAMLAARVGMVNELAGLCEVVGVDVDEVMAAVGMDDRIGPRFLTAGLGFGGSCFPKDVSALCHLGRSLGRPLPILEQVLRRNAIPPRRVVRMLEEGLGPLAGRRIALLGLAFKPGTSDCRESRALALHTELQRRGAQVVVHDPQAILDAPVLRVEDPAAALEGADACVVATAWPEYGDLPWSRLIHSMNTPLVIDGWRLLDADRLAGADYRAIGRGHPHESSDSRSRDGNTVPSLHEERTQRDAAAR